RPPTGLVNAALPVGLIGIVRALLGPEFFFQAALGLLDPCRPRTGHRLRVRCALRFETLLGFLQPGAAALRGRELRRQLVAAAVPVELVLGRISRLGLL